MQKPQRTRAAYSQLILEHREDSMQRLSSLLLCLLAILETCSADFVFTFDLDSFTTERLCDRFTANRGCETYLSIFCLRGPSSQQSQVNGDCPLGTSGRVNDANTAITRTIMSPQPWPGSFQLFIKAFDDDPNNSDDLLDNIFIDLTLSQTDGFTATSAYTGICNRVTVNMRFQLRCDNNFHGSDCVTYCLEMDDDTNGHYTCNSDGSFRCRTGFENPGNNCRDRVTSCSADPCMNGRSCTAIGLDSHVCACAPGYTGENCEMEIDDCRTDPCQNGGTCIDMTADYMCECVMGFVGKNCSTNTDECAGVECAGNSTCQDLINGFMCVCNTGCECKNCTDIVDPCQSSPCAEGSTCIALSPFNHSCSCALGFTGSDCSTNIDECTNSSCPANSQCVDGIAGFQCECDEGFQGDNCTSSTVQRVVQTSVIVGAVVGGVGGLLILLLLVVVVICIVATRRAKQKTFTPENETDNVYYDVKSEPRVVIGQERGLADNPLYGSASIPAAVRADHNGPSAVMSSPDTLFQLENPIYGDDGNNSTPPLYSVPNNTRDVAPDPNSETYTYARVDNTHPR